MPSYEIHRDDEWEALYVDGKLDTGPTESYLIWERLTALLGIDVIDDNAFMRGGNQRSDAAQTLDEVHAYAEARDARLAAAAARRAEAQRLSAEADAIEAGQ